MKTPNTIIVPTDFSKASRAAFPQARALAVAWDAEVVLVHAVPPEAYPTHSVASGRSFPNFIDELNKGVTHQLEDHAKEFGSDVRVSWESRTGRAFEEVERVALERDAAMIVVATHGYSGVKRALLGSTAERIVRSATVPVMTVRSAGAAIVTPGASERILVPTDFSDLSLRAAECADWFATDATEVLAVHAYESLTYPVGPLGLSGADFGTVEAERRTHASEQMAQWTKGLKPRFKRLRDAIVEGVPADCIVRIADEMDVDLIVISTHGHTGFKHLYLGSVAEKVVREAGCAVLTLNANIDSSAD